MKLYFFLQSFLFALEPNEPEEILLDWLKDVEWISDEVLLSSSDCAGDDFVSSENSYHDPQPTDAELNFISNQWDELLSEVGLEAAAPDIPSVDFHDKLDSLHDENLLSGHFNGRISQTNGTEGLIVKSYIKGDLYNRFEPVVVTSNSSGPRLGHDHGIHDELKLSSLLAKPVAVDLRDKKGEEGTGLKIGVRLTKAHADILRNLILLPTHGESRLDVFRRASQEFERCGLSQISLSSFQKHLRRLENGANVSRRRSFRKYTPLHFEILKTLVLQAGPSLRLRNLYMQFLEQLEHAGGLIPMKLRSFIDNVAKLRRM